MNRREVLQGLGLASLMLACHAPPQVVRTQLAPDHALHQCVEIGIAHVDGLHLDLHLGDLLLGNEDVITRSRGLLGGGGFVVTRGNDQEQRCNKRNARHGFASTRS